jgi:hypothetical protein
MRTRMLTSVFWVVFVACVVVLGLACLETVDAQSKAQTQHSCHQPPTRTSCHTCEQLTLSPG